MLKAATVILAGLTVLAACGGSSNENSTSAGKEDVQTAQAQGGDFCDAAWQRQLLLDTCLNEAESTTETICACVYDNYVLDGLSDIEVCAVAAQTLLDADLSYQITAAFAEFDSPLQDAEFLVEMSENMGRGIAACTD